MNDHYSNISLFEEDSFSFTGFEHQPKVVELDSESHLLDASEPAEEELWENSSDYVEFSSPAQSQLEQLAHNILLPINQPDNEWSDFVDEQKFDIENNFELIPVKPVLKENDESLIGVKEKVSLNMKNQHHQSISSTNSSNSDCRSRDALRESIDKEAKVKMCLNRKDVVIKSILRSMRKYYSDLLQDNTDYRRKMRNINLKHKLLISCSAQVTDSMGVSDFKKSLPFYLAAVSFPIDVKKILKKASKNNSKQKAKFLAGTDIINNIERALGKFSKKILEDFIKMPEICVLLLNYLSKVNNDEYKEHYRMLKDLSNDSIREYHKTGIDSEEKVEAKIFDLAK